MKDNKKLTTEEDLKSALADATKRLISKIEYLRYLKSLTYIETENKNCEDLKVE